MAGSGEEDPGAALLHPEEGGGGVPGRDALQLGGVSAQDLRVGRFHKKERRSCNGMEIKMIYAIFKYIFGGCLNFAYPNQFLLTMHDSLTV